MASETTASDGPARVPDHLSAGFDPAVVRAWALDDPDPADRAALLDLLDLALGGTAAEAAARTELEDRFAGPLEFGTAGLRGAMAAGPNRMNRAVVIRAAAGLAAFLDDYVGHGFSVVIGCDGRHHSEEFAEDTAAVVTAAGGRALLLPVRLPTPLTAFALEHLGADAAVMVTASHNPKDDNGYKVYLGVRPLRAVYERTGDPAGDELAAAGAGAQIVPPFDALISEQITRVPSVAAVPRAADGWERLGPAIVMDYLEAIGSAGVTQTAPLRIVHTAMHGVGTTTALAALERAGCKDLHPVPEQAEPDPEFPTVVFPNPEEAGALDLAMELAREVDADLILANDPDADRFSAAIPDASAAVGWRQLAGDEVGLLLGEYLAGFGHVGPEAVFANSIVSSRGLGAACAAHGIAHRTTLTGFKWISRVPGVAYGYEEALGYCVAPQLVRDKDGISAAVFFAGLVSQLAAKDMSVDDELARIRARDGVYLTRPLTFRVTDTTLIADAMERLRGRPPQALGDVPIVTVTDLAQGSAQLPPTDGLLLEAETGDRVIIRPSGTEPKLKCYLEAYEPVPGHAAAEVPAAQARAAARLAAMADGLTNDLDLG
ncbi:phospho-sugar mutase [Brevibacterium sp. 50QC2O2]|uniref:phospho-sugar mutase n=1 Tax=Brevibacterium sp. 50QC2O2 TaxID=2968459 RepID=UPI00211B9BE3|nr:phospho-sugar mutase [Brevibacterium sp. 50QC2O2]MCQ9387914.1 phospho-sugar mutase [Brevibacterium sp. 50QC2O2]